MHRRHGAVAGINDQQRNAIRGLDGDERPGPVLDEGVAFAQAAGAASA